MSQGHNAVRLSVLRAAIWVMVLTSGPLVGAKIFDLVVLVGAWSASPPQSLHLLPYGPDWPVDTGDFFIPFSGLSLVASLVAAVAGWRTYWGYRGLLLTPLFLTIVALVVTVTLFWPLNAGLWYGSQGREGWPGDPAILSAMARQWVQLDWLRVAIAFTAFVAAARLLAMRVPDRRTADDPVSVRVAVAIGALGVLGFAAYFVLSGLG